MRTFTLATLMSAVLSFKMRACEDTNNNGICDEDEELGAELELAGVVREAFEGPPEARGEMSSAEPVDLSRLSRTSSLKGKVGAQDAAP